MLSASSYRSSLSVFSTSFICSFSFSSFIRPAIKQAGLGLCKASRDNPVWKRPSHVLQVFQTKDVLYQDTLSSLLHLRQVSSPSSVL